MYIEKYAHERTENVIYFAFVSNRSGDNSLRYNCMDVHNTSVLGGDVFL